MEIDIGFRRRNTRENCVEVERLPYEALSFSTWRDMDPTICFSFAQLISEFRNYFYKATE